MAADAPHGECLMQLTVIRALALPATERLSKPDPFVKVKIDGALVGRTKAVPDDAAPVWNQSLTVTVPCGAQRCPAAVITLELWDENTLKDTHVGTALLDTRALAPAELAYQELRLEWTKEKYAEKGRQARLVVGITGHISTFGSVLAATRHIPGVLFNTVQRRAYLPLPCPQLPPGAVYVAVEWESDAVDVKLLLCVPGAPLHLDLYLAGRQVTKVRRRVYRDGLPVMPGLTAFEEVKLDDVPLSTDWSKLIVLLFDKHLLWSSSSDRVVAAHGWHGALGFEQAARTLHSVDVDRAEQEIFMPIRDDPAAVAAGWPPEAMLLIDWDKSDVDIKLAVVDAPGGRGLDKAWDLTLHSGQAVKKTTQIFVPPVSRVGGKWRLQRICELDDVAYGTSFASIGIHKFQLTNQRSWDVGSLVPLSA